MTLLKERSRDPLGTRSSNFLKAVGRTLKTPTRPRWRHGKYVVSKTCRGTRPSFLSLLSDTGQLCRAERHEWTVNPNLATADCAPVGYRQLKPTAPRLDVKSIAARVCDAVQQGPASNCDLVKQRIVVWRDSGHCSINHLELLPSDGYRQTVAGRRRRLRDELRKRMQALGWQLVEGVRSMKFEKI
jgi:hypothetical protein